LSYPDGSSMWCSRRQFVLWSAVFLSGCGFRPLYGQRSAGNSVPSQFSRIEVSRIEGRAGNHLSNYLIDQFSARGGNNKKEYRLDIALNESKYGLAIREDESVTRFNLHLVGSVRLTRLQDQKILFEESVRTISAYNVVQSEFATLSAERDAEDRAARDMGREISTRLAIFFQRQAL
jgi:LPS-assembly lipoprotein